MNPLVPTAFDVLMTIVAVLAFAYSATAFVSIVRVRRVEPLVFLFWAAIVLLVPIVGPTIWFLIGRNRLRVSSTRS